MTSTKFDNTFLSKLSVTMANAAHHHGFAPCNICLIQASEVVPGMTIRYQQVVGRETMRKDVVVTSVNPEAYNSGSLMIKCEGNGWFRAKPTDSLILVGGAA
jgi:hypothetical protein